MHVWFIGSPGEVQIWNRHAARQWDSKCWKLNRAWAALGDCLILLPMIVIGLNILIWTLLILFFLTYPLSSTNLLINHSLVVCSWNSAPLLSELIALLNIGQFGWLTPLWNRQNQYDQVQVTALMSVTTIAWQASAFLHSKSLNGFPKWSPEHGIVPKVCWEMYSFGHSNFILSWWVVVVFFCFFGGYCPNLSFWRDLSTAELKQECDTLCD